MNSCLYDIDIMHYRTQPQEYKFKHKTFMFYLDLDELDQLKNKLGLFGWNQRRVFNFCEKDHVDFGGETVKENVLRYVKSQGVTESIQQVMLLTNVRTLGYIFNPVSFYFCFDAQGQPVCSVCEVGNTFGELKPYFLGPETRTKNKFSSVQKKYYYISPFIDLDVPMDFRLTVPDARLLIQIDDLKPEGRLLYTTMKGKQKPLTNGSLWWHGIKFPFITLKVIILIHFHAAVLHFVKRVPHHKKKDNPDLQREVNRVCKKAK